jgi:hypothetical protein
MATSDEPDPLERIMLSMTDAEDLKALTIHMTTRAIEYFSDLARSLSEDELRRQSEDGSLLAEAKRLSEVHFDEDMRRWFIAHGYL